MPNSATIVVTLMMLPWPRAAIGGTLGERTHLIGRCEVGTDELGAPALLLDRSDDLRATLLAPAGDHDVGALTCQSLRRRPPNPRRPAGDKRALPFEVVHTFLSVMDCSVQSAPEANSTSSTRSPWPRRRGRKAIGLLVGALGHPLSQLGGCSLGRLKLDPAGDRLLELPHPAAERAAHLGDPLRAEDEERDDEQDQKLGNADEAWHGGFLFGSDEVTGAAEDAGDLLGRDCLQAQLLQLGDHGAIDDE